MAPEPFVLLGRVVKTHGLRGEVAVAAATRLPFAFPPGLEVWLVPPPPGVRNGHIQSIRQGPKGPLVKIAGIDDIATAKTAVGAQIMARPADLPSEWHEEQDLAPDPVGLLVTETNRGLLGEVVELIETGANDVWVVHGALGEVLLPVIDDVVLDIDWGARAVTVRALPGLLPEDADA